MHSNRLSLFSFGISLFVKSVTLLHYSKKVSMSFLFYSKLDVDYVVQVMAIVRNLQITVNNIHVRLEDGTTDPSCKVSLGVTLESLTLRTCNGKWEETLVTEQTSNAFFKVNKLTKACFLPKEDLLNTMSFKYTQVQTIWKHLSTKLKRSVLEFGD